VVINPVIMPESDEIIDFKEGCLSFPYEMYQTKRHRSIWCSYFDVDGCRHLLTKIDGFRAIIWQHEADHLVGRLLPHHGVREV
jgi:peptide deformylase